MGYDVLVRLTLNDEADESFELTDEAKAKDPNIDSIEGVIELDFKEWVTEDEFYGPLVETIAVQTTKR